MKKIFLLASLVVLTASCRKKDDPVTTPGKVTISIQNVAGAQPLVLNTNWYVNANGDSMMISEYKYYLSNVVFEAATTNFKEPESYHLIDERESGSRTFTITNVPDGTYSKLHFMIGVDEQRNTSGAQTGALDPAHGMFWDWNTGYIMSKMEGTSPQASTFQNKFSYHIAGFQGDNSVVRDVTLVFSTPIKIKAGSAPKIYLKADMLEWFKTPHTISLNALPVVGSEGLDAVEISVNYQDMFTIDRIEDAE